MKHKCDACDGKDVEKFAKECMEKYGWYAHYVMLDASHANYHTHGVYESFNHCDFQIVLPIDYRLAHKLFGDLIMKVKEGTKFVYNHRYSEIIKNFDVLFILRKENSLNERAIKRLILPDAQGNLEQEKMAEPYNHQFDKIEG
jgi:hypothetical protein